MAKYSINEIASSRELLSEELFREVSAALAGTPIKIKRLGARRCAVSQGDYRGQGARRELIEQEKAQFEIQKIQMERDLERETAEETSAHLQSLRQGQKVAVLPDGN